jgi:Polysaccharide lyase
MRKFLRVTALLLLFLALMGVAEKAIPVHIYDGFESSKLSRFRWSRYRFAPGAIVAQDRYVRSGRKALAITVHSGDCFEQGVDGSASTARAELMEALWLFSHTGRTYAYSFSIYIPQDFPKTPQRLVLAQWRQLCEARQCGPDRPILAIRYEEGHLLVTRQNQDEKIVLYQGVDDARGRWLDFRFVARFEASESGFVRGNLNGREIATYRGPTVFQPAHGYPRHGLVYFKMGLYRDALDQPPWTVYIDEYRKDQLPN